MRLKPYTRKMSIRLYPQRLRSEDIAAKYGSAASSTSGLSSRLLNGYTSSSTSAKLLQQVEAR